MPIYEYECNKCGVLEVNQRIVDSPLTRCPRCRGKVHKLISQSSFRLKGTGWYATDYGKGNGNGNGKSRKDTTEPKSPAAKTETAKSETKKDSTTGTSTK
jgi:putative FmdB family regulatory protein